MQTFNQLLVQIRDLFQSMPASSRLVAGLLLACVLISSVFLVRGSTTKSTEYLFGGRSLSESELQAAEAAFGIAGLSGSERVGQRISVPTSERNIYLKALADNDGFPKQLGSTIEQALNSSNFLESLEVGRQRFHAARENAVATAIKNLDFVEDAFLTHDKQQNGFSAMPLQTASVYVRPKGNKPLTDEQKRNIMRAVATVFAGLKYENISVMDLASGATMHGGSDPMTAEQQKYYQLKTRLEDELKTKARNLLTDYGDVRLEVYVDLDTTLREATEILKYNEKPTTLQVSSTKRDSQTTQPNTAGRPGAEPNAIANRSQSLQDFAQETAKSKESTEEERKVTGHETTLIDRVGLKMNHAAISVAIPVSYYKAAFQRQWLDANPDKTPNDLTTLDKAIVVPGIAAIKDEVDKKIQRTLAALLPSATAGSDRFPSVTVTDYMDIPTEAIAGPSMAETMLVYLLGNWQWIGMFGLAGAALMMLRSMAKATPNGTPDAQFDRGFEVQLQDPAMWDMSALEEGEMESMEAASAGDGASPGSPQKRQFDMSGGEIKEELTTLVRENPDAAASLLRSWIGEAA